MGEGEDSEAEEEMVVYMDDDEMEGNDDDIPVSYQNALVLNETYQNTLHELLDHLESSLRENRLRQRVLDTEIFELNAGKKVVDGAAEDLKLRPLHISAKDDSAKVPLADSAIKKATLSVFSSPYFKDVNFFSHPDNPDTVKKKAGDELDVYLQNPRTWTNTDKQKLKKIVIQL